MKSNVYIHKSNITNFLLKITLGFLVFFALFGIYKSGYRVYHNGYGNIFTLVKPLLYVICAVLISFVYAKITKKKFISYNLLSNVLISLIIIPEFNFFLAIFLMIVINIISHFVKLNPASLYMVISILISMILKNYSFLNVFEQEIHHEYVLSDYLLGFGYGGISNTFLILIIISFITFLCIREYKKEIPLLAFTVYYVLLLIKLIFIPSVSSSYFINNNLLFAFVFIAPLSIYTPYSKGGCYIYGVLLGILTFALSFIDLDLGVYLSILLLSLISGKIDKYIV